MGNPRGFLQIRRSKADARGITDRLRDWAEVDPPVPALHAQAQAARCMDCGIPFCNQGCPLSNLIPDWNDAVFRGDWTGALDALLATNNFPEITGRVCPAPCEAACVLGLTDAAVTIKDIERAISSQNLAVPLPVRPARPKSGQRVAVVGSGPAGLTVAQQLARVGHAVTVFEKADRSGGLLRYGIPDFKLDKDILDRRLQQLEAEGVRFQHGADLGVAPMMAELLPSFDALVLCVGAARARELDVPGRELAGVHVAMDYLTEQNRVVAGDLVVAKEGRLTAKDRRVLILGGGDTGSDCLGTALRQGATSVVQLELMPAPPQRRLPHNPWPEWPLVLRTSSSQEEGGSRDFAVQTRGLVGRGGHVTALRAIRVGSDGRPMDGSEFEIPCDLVLLAMGFVGSDPSPLFDQLAPLGVRRNERGTLVTDEHGWTGAEGIFAAGDVVRGASLVVWAIAEGRRVAAAVETYLTKTKALRSER